MRLKTIIAGLLLTSIGMPAFAQGGHRGLGGNDSTIMSIGERLFNLEKKTDEMERKKNAFQLFVNMKADYTENVVGDVKGGAFHGSFFRPEMRGVLGKDDQWGYRIRLNLNKELSGPLADGLNNCVDYLAVYYRLNNHWDFAFGKKSMNYGTFEQEWNPLYVLQYHEINLLLPSFSNVAIDANYTIAKQTFGLEMANANRQEFYDIYPFQKYFIEKSNHSFQYTFSWAGHFFDDRFRTLWSYTLLNQAKQCYTHQVALGQHLILGKWAIQLDYIGAYGTFDYLVTVTKDAYEAGFFDDLSNLQYIDRTSYNEVLLDVGYCPTPRWNIFVKTGVSTSSAPNIEMWRNYRKTFEYTGAVQYFIDKTQDLRVSLAYIGKHIYFDQKCGLENQNFGRIELSLIYRLKAF